MALALVLPLLSGCDGDDDAGGPDPNQEQPNPLLPASFYASWAASPQDFAELLPFPGAPPPTPQVIENQTLRQIIRLSAGGSVLRVQLSNLFGSEPLVVDGAGVALSQGSGAIDASSHVALTFAGAPGVVLASGQEAWSDPIPFVVNAQADLAISLFIAGAAPIATTHSLGQQTAYLAAGDAVSAPSLPVDDTRQSYYWLSRVDASGTNLPRVIVAFGDSITDGFGSTVDANHRYPNYLSERLNASAPAEFSVVNAGISGNRILNDVIGPAGVSRFARDALGQTGASDVVILLGINDIGFSGFVPEQEVSLEQVTQGLADMVSAANASGVRAFLATLLPFQGTAAPYYSEAGEAKRQAVNAWIRANTDVAGVVDFDQVMQDPMNPLALRGAYNSGDFLHPNDDGYANMAAAIDPAWFD